MSNRYCPDCKRKSAYKDRQGNVHCYECGRDWRDDTSLDIWKKPLQKNVPKTKSNSTSGKASPGL